MVIGQCPNMTCAMKDPELRLLIAACHAAFAECAVDVEARDVDWQRLLALARRHRVEALCWQGLQRATPVVPTEIAEAFAARSAAIVEMNLRAAAECDRLRSTIQQNDIDCLFLKGLTLGSLAYPQPFLKMSWDIDLLIEGDSLRRAAQVLRAAGYNSIIPRSADDDRLERWHFTRKESVWHREADGFTLDLHTRLADNPRMLSELGVNSPSQMVHVAAGIGLPTLAKDELFAYLCVHGASSAWFRLKWVCDLAALLRHDPEGEIARLYGRSQELGSGRSADQALLLAVELFGVRVPGGLERSMRSRPISRWLANLAMFQLASETAPTERPLGTASIHYSQLVLQPSWQFKMSELTRQIRDSVGQGA